MPIPVSVAFGLRRHHAPPILHGLDTITDEEDPPELIKGILHQGCKLLLSGTSKSNKTWLLIALALCVACGVPWLGFPTVKARVLYINFEVQRWAFKKRMRQIIGTVPGLTHFNENFSAWHLRGMAQDFASLRPMLQDHLDLDTYGMIIVDPVYKLLGDRDENANGDITDLMNEFENLAQSTGAAIVMAHHFAKGDPSVKDPIDRMSGAGAWARDPDAILVLTPHEEPDCFTVDSILRNLPALDPFVVQWNMPIMERAEHMDPQSLRTRKGRPKKLTDTAFIALCLTKEPRSVASIIDAGTQGGVVANTVRYYLRRLSAAGVIGHRHGTYWAK